MPMTWDSQADAKLLQAIIIVYEVKLSGSQNERIAKLMGPECTAKAITHRLTKVKALANMDQATDASPRNNSTSKRKTTTTLVATTGKAGKGKEKRKASDERIEDSDDDEGADGLLDKVGNTKRRMGPKNNDSGETVNIKKEGGLDGYGEAGEAFEFI